MGHFGVLNGPCWGSESEMNSVEFLMGQVSDQNRLAWVIKGPSGCTVKWATYWV